MLSVLLFTNNLRLPENEDWVVYILLACTILYLFLLNILQRDASIKSYLLQDFSETNNIFQSWIVIGLITTLLSATLISAFSPIVPAEISALQLFGYELSSFGFTLISVAFFFILKALFSYLFFQFLGGSGKWDLFCSASSKFYLIFSLLLFILCFYHNFFSLDWRGEHYTVNPGAAFGIYLYLAVFIVLYKNVYYLFNRNPVLPFTWYYKILYICTLQIAPILVLWKLLFI